MDRAGAPSDENDGRPAAEIPYVGLEYVRLQARLQQRTEEAQAIAPCSNIPLAAALLHPKEVVVVSLGFHHELDEAPTGRAPLLAASVIHLIDHQLALLVGERLLFQHFPVRRHLRHQLLARIGLLPQKILDLANLTLGPAQLI